MDAQRTEAATASRQTHKGDTNNTRTLSRIQLVFTEIEHTHTHTQAFRVASLVFFNGGTAAWSHHQAATSPHLIHTRN